VSQNVYFPKRGDVIRINFDPVIGHEQGGYRPALVLSADDYNRIVGLAIVVPITLHAKGYPFEVQIPKEHKVSGVILADHVKCIAWRERKVSYFDSLPDDVLEEVQERLGPLLFP